MSWYTDQFRANPTAFVATYTVDIKGWFENIVRRGRGGMADGALLNSANAICYGEFDLEPMNANFLGYGATTVQMKVCRAGSGGIGGYWVPYKTAHVLPGYADVPRQNPAFPYVFTAGMNGCAFVVTNSPRGAEFMRVYHNQHPEEDEVWALIHAEGNAVISFAGFDEYGSAVLAHGMNPVAFNFLYYRNGSWMYVFQPQQFAALGIGLLPTKVGAPITRAVFG